MSQIRLEFQNKDMEKEYCTLKAQTKIKTFQITLFFCLILFISFGVSSIVSDRVELGSVFFGILAIMAVMLCFSRKLAKYHEILIIIVTFVVIMSSLTYAFLQIHKGSSTLLFLRGWSFASFQVILVNTFPNLKHKVCFIIMVFIARYTVSGLLDTDIFDADVLIRNLLSDAFVIYIFFSFEKKERAIFEDFYDYREQFVKFKDLLENYLPQSITVLNTKAQPLFSNKAFQNLFPESTSASDSDQFQNSQSPSQDVMSPLKSLIIQKNTIRQIGDSSCLSPSLGIVDNIFTLMQNLVDKKFYDQKAFSMSAFMTIKGQKRLFDLILMPITWDKQEAVAVILNDITYQENLITLKLADENKDRVIATVSHELRTPLNGIIGILQIVERQIIQPEVIENIQFIKDNSNLLLSLVNSLLDLQQIQHGKFKLNPSKVEIAKVLKDTLRLFQFQAKEKKIYLDLKIDSGIPVCIKTDENRLKQILINLIGNAIKFTLKGGITVGVKEDSENSHNIIISVIDTGVGIKNEHKSKLFKLYGKLEDGGNLNKYGIGLGLTISDTLARILLNDKNHNKGIEMESEYGQGSKFWFRISKDLVHVTDVGSGEHLLLKNIKSKNIEKSEREEEKTSSNCQEKLQNTSLSMDELDEFKIFSSFESKLQEHTPRDTRGFDSITSRRALKTLSEDLPENEEDVNRIKFADPNHQWRLYNKFKANYNKFNSHNNSYQNQESKGSVLIVDDNAFNLMIVKSFTEELGYSAEPVMSGQGAIDKVKEQNGENIVLILMDCQMPLMDGFETTTILKGMMDRNEIKKIPIVALTANNTQEDIQRCFNSGMVGYLAKPILKEKLHETLVYFTQNNDI